MNTLEFPETIYAQIEEDSGSDTSGAIAINAYPRQFDAVDDSAEWQVIGIYKLQGVRQLRKVTEESPRFQNSAALRRARKGRRR